jgi:hypothetical protein
MEILMFKAATKIQPIKTKRLCAGAYVTTNTAPVAHIEKCGDGDGWSVSYENYSGRWASKRECLDLLEDTATYAETDHLYPISIV